MEAEWRLPRLITMGWETPLSRTSMEAESSLACNSATISSSLELNKFPLEELVSVILSTFDDFYRSIHKICKENEIKRVLREKKLTTGDDFWFQDPNGDPMGVFWLQGVHMIHCSYNSLWMGQIIQPDWDMFQSDHECAKFHAGSRAICGGPVYVSDRVGSHDFDLIKKLVFPDGTVPRCIYFPLPTRDCLFRNPLFDQKTVLKIWNFNKVCIFLHCICII